MKRKEGQSFEDYKKERKQQGENIAFYCRGRIFHNSRIDGTYNVGRNQAKREKRALQVPSILEL